MPHILINNVKSSCDFIRIQCNLHDQINNLLLHISNSQLHNFLTLHTCKVNLLAHVVFAQRRMRVHGADNSPGHYSRNPVLFKEILKACLSSMFYKIAESSNCQKGKIKSNHFMMCSFDGPFSYACTLLLIYLHFPPQWPYRISLLDRVLTCINEKQNVFLRRLTFPISMQPICTST